MMVKKIEQNDLIDNKIEFNGNPSSELNQATTFYKKNNIYYNFIKKEAGEDVFRYFEELGVFQTNEVLILSSRHSFSYDENYLKNIRTIFNLKNLNKLPKINGLFSKINRVIPINGYYIGCYEDIFATQERLNSLFPRVLAKFILWVFYYLPHVMLSLPVINVITSAIGISHNKCLAIKDVQKIMENNGFSIAMTKRFSNKTFFIAKKNEKVKSKNYMMFTNVRKLLRKTLIINL
jgi:hypothetical protein